MSDPLALPQTGTGWGACGTSEGDALGQGREGGRRVGVVAKAGRCPAPDTAPQAEAGPGCREQITVVV